MTQNFVLRLVSMCLLLLTALPSPAFSRTARSVPRSRHRRRAYQVGTATWYGKKGQGLQGKPTASGDAFDKHDFTAASRTLPLGSQVKVTNLSNGKSVVVTVNDRGPHNRKAIIDLSQAAAAEIGRLKEGLFRVRLDVLKQPAQATATEAKR